MSNNFRKKLIEDWSYTFSDPQTTSSISTIAYPQDVEQIQKIFVSSKFSQSLKNQMHEVKQENLVASFREFLWFGRLFGILPIAGFHSRGGSTSNLRVSQIGKAYSLVVIFGLGVNVVFAFLGIGRGKQAVNAGDYAWAPVNVIFYSLGTFIFSYFWKFRDEFVSLFRNWSNVTLTYTEIDKKLRRDVNIVAGVVLTSAVLENAVSHLKLFPVVQRSEANNLQASIAENENQTAFEIYYIRSHRAWAELVPYHPVMATYVFLSNKFCLYSWNFMDLSIALLARALYFKFKVLFKAGERLLEEGSVADVYDPKKWKTLTKDHDTLCGVLADFENFLSPLIFVSYGVNIYFICLQMHLGLTPSGKSSFIASLYAIWSFFHLVGRVYVISLSASRINEWAHKTLDVIRKCPNEMYMMEIERSERFLSMSTIGLTGLRCFVITKPLLLQVVSVVFTFEIVLLQAAQTPLEPTNGQPQSQPSTLEKT